MIKLHHIPIIGFLFILFTEASCLFAASEKLDTTETAILFREANKLFHEASDIKSIDPKKAHDLYSQSVMRLERIVNEGQIHNGKLYYNIGNTYFEMNDLGRAILNYRRAEALIPNDPNLRQNLTYARSKCLDKIPVKQETKVLRTLFFWHYDFSTKTRIIILGVFFPAFWILATIRLFRKSSSLNGLMLTSACLAVIMIVSLAIDSWNRSKNISGVIIASEVTARKGDSETYQPSFNEPLHSGTEFDLRENRGNWFLIELADGRSCWVPAKSVGLLSNPS